MADKYDVPRLRTLVVERLRTDCDPRKDESDFIEALRVVDGCTAENTIWDLLVPKVKANLHTLLKNEVFRDVVKEQSALTFQLLSAFALSSEDQSPSQPKSHPVANAEMPDLKRPRYSEGPQQSPVSNPVAPLSGAPVTPSISVQPTPPITWPSFGQSLGGQQSSASGYPLPSSSSRGGPFPSIGRGRGRGRES